ncbi:MAG: alpha/beta hydrolase [Chloroflexi bacterium]|nr:alpha/beta hydrolase [Chloroflexota bacterium]
MIGNVQNSLSFVHCFLPSTDPISPITLLVLHGGDENELTRLPLGRALAPGAALLSPRGRILEGDKPRYYPRFADLSFDRENLTLQTHALADFVTAAAAAHGFDAGSVVVAGYSNGANMAASLLLLRPEVLAGALLIRPVAPFVPERLPDLTGKPIFIAAGDRDPISPPAESERLALWYRVAGAAVVLRRHPGDHEIVDDEIAAGRDWLRSVGVTLARRDAGSALLPTATPLGSA